MHGAALRARQTKSLQADRCRQRPAVSRQRVARGRRDSLVGPQLSDLRQRDPFKLGLARIDLALEHRSEVPRLMAADVHVVVVRERVVEAL